MTKIGDMDDRQWANLLAGLHDDVEYLRQYGSRAREHAALTKSDIDGFPTSSMPESSIASGRVSDPTGSSVVQLAGGRLATEGHPATSDTWDGSRNPSAHHVRQMQRETNDAANRVKGAVDAMRKAIIVPSPPETEYCGCGVSRSAATNHGTYPQGWVVASSKCRACDRRSARANRAS